jgi:predicted enzyme related to lactoylglutathione lyase
MPNPFQHVPRGDNPYVMLDVGEGTGGNFVQSPIAGDHPFWLADVQVQDMSKTFEAGGSVVSGQAQQPARAWLPISKDPRGAILGRWQVPAA